MLLHRRVGSPFLAAVGLLFGNPLLADAEPTGLVGSETCEFCHEELAAAFRSSVHWRANPRGSCESCHGPGEAHVEDADPARIRRLGPDRPPGEVSATCLDCHRRDERHAGFRRGPHAIGGVDCTGCHDPHTPSARPLLRASTPRLCYECHGAVRAQFSLNEHHPVEEGGVGCEDCHDPHRRSARGVLDGFKQQACLACHAEYRGPWFFEHEAIAVEGCTACHAPHGSVNRHLLTYQRVGDLCLQCHPEQPFFHDLTDPTGRRTTEVNDCTRCHSEIHGSNSDALFLN